MINEPHEIAGRLSEIITFSDFFSSWSYLAKMNHVVR